MSSSFRIYFCSQFDSITSYPSRQDAPQLSSPTAVETASYLLPMLTSSASSGGEEDMSLWLVQLTDDFQVPLATFQSLDWSWSCLIPHPIPTSAASGCCKEVIGLDSILLYTLSFSFSGFFQLKSYTASMSSLQLSFCTNIGLANTSPFNCNGSSYQCNKNMHFDWFHSVQFFSHT